MAAVKCLLFARCCLTASNLAANVILRIFPIRRVHELRQDSGGVRHSRHRELRLSGEGRALFWNFRKWTDSEKDSSAGEELWAPGNLRPSISEAPDLIAIFKGFAA